MNESGVCVQAMMNYFKIDPDDLLVIYDDLDMLPGTIKLREKGGSGGHNGMKSIIAHIGTQDFKRIRAGIGKDKNYQTADWVLGHFSIPEMELMLQSGHRAVDAVMCYLDYDFSKAMNLYN